MKRKGVLKWLCAVMIIVMMLSVGGCGDSSHRMMFGTGGTAGTYYSYGGVLAQYMKSYAGVRVTAVSTGGSKVNIQSIQDGDFQLGFTQSDVMTYGWDGTRAIEKDGPTHDFRVLGCLYAETVQLITMDDSIESVEDLRGKSVSIGEAGSGVYFNALDVLNGAGITLENVDRVAAVTGCSQVHLARHKTMPDPSVNNNRSIYYGGALYPPEDPPDRIVPAVTGLDEGTDPPPVPWEPGPEEPPDDGF